jgi:hypothetical protein
MFKSQCRNRRNIKYLKNQGNMTPPKINNSIITDSNCGEVDEISENSKEQL